MPLNAPRPKGIIQRKITKLLQRKVKMIYKFKCKTCNKEEEKEIAIKEYDKEKIKQVCSACGSKMDRVLEWEGFAEGSGQGWFGARGGNII